MALAPGLLSFVRIVVADTDTAIALGSGDVPVLGTPRLLARAEAAAVAAIEPSLEPGLTSVGTSAVVEHKRPSPVGAQVMAEAELTQVDGRRLVFSFIARQEPLAGSPDDQDAVVGSGTLERVLVDKNQSCTGPSTSDHGNTPRRARSAAEAELHAERWAMHKNTTSPLSAPPWSGLSTVRRAPNNRASSRRYERQPQPAGSSLMSRRAGRSAWHALAPRGT
jgi:fluoroacetyl-CoA thioesterase